MASVCLCRQDDLSGDHLDAQDARLKLDMQGKMDERVSWMRYLRHRAFTKHTSSCHDLRTDLKRCLTTWQLTLLGLGSTIGVGIYVMLGVMAKEEAGPSVVLSFVIAIVVTLINALVFAEFSTHVPQTGAAYMYLYKVFGEFAAFLIGSIGMTGGLLGNCVGARAWSGMLDSLFNHTIQDSTTNLFGKIQFGTPFAENLDIVAFLFQLTLTIIVSCNIFCTSIVNTILGIITTSVLGFVFIYGVFYGDSRNFLNADHGGFLPFGVFGVIKAASLALYATSGFDMISMSAEEAKNPSKSIPRAMIAELCIVGLVYIGAAIGMLFLIPYWLIDLRAPLPSAFKHAGFPLGQLIVTVGPLFGVTNLQMIGMYGISRCTYRMAKDRMLFSFFLTVDKSTGVPRRAVMFVGLSTAVLALVCDLTYVVKITVILMLINYMSVGPALIRLKMSENVNSGISLLSTSVDVNGRSGDCAMDSLSKRPAVSSYEQEITVDEDEPAGEQLGYQLGKDSIKSEDEEFFEIEEDPQSYENVGVNLNSNYSSTILGNGATTLPSVVEHEMLDSGNEKYLEGDTSISTKPVQVLNDNEELETSIMYKSSKETSLLDGDGYERSTKTIKSQDTSNSWLTKLVPGVLSADVILFLHVISCVALAGQMVYAKDDIFAMKIVAVIACGMLVSVIMFFSVCLGSMCKSSRPCLGFKTPLMPLVPTLSVLLSSMMVFSAAEKNGLIELIVMFVMASVVYVVMTFFRYRSDELTDLKERGRHDKEEQAMSLIADED